MKKQIKPIILILFLIFSLSACGKKQVENNIVGNNEPISNNESEEVNNNNDNNNQAQQEEPEIISSDIDTSNWQTYRNEEYGFEVKYPEYLLIDVYNTGKTVCFFVNKNECFFSVGIYGDLKRFDQNKILFPVGKESLKYSNSFVGINNQYSANKIEMNFKNEEGNIEGEMYFIEANNKLYYLRYNKNNDFVRDSFEKVLKSFIIL